MEAGGELNIETESSSGQNNFSSRSLTSILNFQWQKQMIMINLIILSRLVKIGKAWLIFLTLQDFWPHSLGQLFVDPLPLIND